MLCSFQGRQSRWNPSNRLANSYVLHLTFGSLCLIMSLPKHLEFWCEFRCRVCPINPQLSNLNGCVLLQVLLVRDVPPHMLCTHLGLEMPGPWAYYILRPGLTNSFPFPFSFQDDRRLPVSLSSTITVEVLCACSKQAVAECYAETLPNDPRVAPPDLCWNWSLS